MVWIILGIIAVILLFLYFGEKSAVWGGLTIGIILGFLFAIFAFIQSSKFYWNFVIEGAVAWTIIGFIAELLGKIGDKLSKK